MNGTPYYLFTRAQLLAALEAHVGSMPMEDASRVRGEVLQFLDSDAARAGELIVTPLSGADS